MGYYTALFFIITIPLTWVIIIISQLWGDKICDWLIWCDYTPVWLMIILAERDQKIIEKIMEDFDK